MDRLAGMLSRERHLLEVLLFKLVEARHLLAAGEARFLPWAAAEIDRAVRRVREAEVQRAMLVSELARELNISPDTLTLRALADECLDPYDSIFTDHRDALLALVAEIESVAQENRRLANGNLRGVEEVLSMIADRSSEPDVKTYGPTARRATSQPVRFDEAL